MNQNIDGDSILHLITNLTLIHENLKFADQKAGVLIAANSAILAFTDRLLNAGTRMSLRAYAFAGAVGLIVGAALAFAVIMPRGDKMNSKRGPGIVDPIRIGAYSTIEDFLNAISSAQQDDFIKELHLMHYDYSSINRAKYAWLRRSILISATAWIITLSSIALSKF